MKKNIILIVMLSIITLYPIALTYLVHQELRKEIATNQKIIFRALNELRREKMPVENPPQWDERVTGVNGGHIWHHLDGKYCTSPKYLYYIDKKGDSVYIHKDCNKEMVSP